jgi:hypothetical protein
MPFVPDDADRINHFLNLDTDLVADTIIPRMDILTARSAVQVEEVLTILTGLTTLESKLATLAGDADFALTKLDVIEWQPGQRAVGILFQTLNLIARLGKIFKLTPDTISITAFLSAMGISSVSTGIQVPKGRV